MSTPAENLAARLAARDAYNENADYDEGSGSLAKAQAFRTAIRRLIGLWSPQKSKNSESEIWIDLASLQKQLDAVDKWIKAQPQPATSGASGNYAGYSKITLANGRD